MKRFPIIGALLLIPAMLLTALVGCDKGKVVPEKPADKKDAPVVEKAGAKVDITAATEGTFTGVVKLKGDAPEPKTDPRILDHKDKTSCMAGGGKHIQEQTWLVKDGLVENVVVSLEPAAGKKFNISDELKKAAEKKQVLLDQPYCAYVPHIVGLYADVQPIVIKNSAKFLHNVKVIGGVKNGDTDTAVAANSELPPRTFKKDNNPIPVQCSIHTWMNAKIITFDHPYFAVTNEKGEFKIDNVPVGEEFTVYMWHESMSKKTDSGKVTTKAGEKTNLDLELSK